MTIPWFRIAAIAAIIVAVVSAYLWASHWFDENQKTLDANAQQIERDASDIKTRDANIVALNNSIANLKAGFEARIADLTNDLRVLAEAKDAALRRAKSFNTLRKEIADAPLDRPASDVLVHAVGGVRVRLRGFQEAGPTASAGSDPHRAADPA